MKSDAILEKISFKLKESDPEKRTLTNIFQYHFTDERGEIIKNIVMDLKELEIFEGVWANPDVEITVSDEDFYLIGIKEISFTDLLDKGKVIIKGDQEAFHKMVAKFQFNSRK